MHNRRMDRCHNEKKVAIAGGGIAGMASALSLARAGWQAQVYERAAQFTEVGAGVQLGPNVTRILRAWGLERALLEVAHQPKVLYARSALTGEVLAEMDLLALAHRHGAPYVTVHRADLHALLHSAAVAAGVEVHGGVCVLGLENTQTDVLLRSQPNDDHSNIQQTQFALGVIADGVWSTLRQDVLGDGPPAWTGHIAYRALMQQSALPESLRSQNISVWMGPDLHVVTYPVSGGDRLNVVCLLEASMDDAFGDDPWSLSKTDAQLRLDLQRALRFTCPALQAQMEACQGWRLWPLYARPPMTGPAAHGQGRLAMVGDAAHPMLPYLAQGAGMAIEDARSLGHWLEDDSAATLDQQLARFAHARWRRNARVQAKAFQNGRLFHAKGTLGWVRDLGLRMLGERLMRNDWLYRNQPFFMPPSA